jgi:hypothetical protein
VANGATASIAADVGGQRIKRWVGLGVADNLISLGRFKRSPPS